MTAGALVVEPGIDPVRVVSATGELDVLSVAPMLVDPPAWLTDAAAVVLDLTAVTFCDSAAARLVEHLERQCTQSGTTFRAVAPPGSAARYLLANLGLAGSLQADRHAAVAQLRAGRTDS